MRLRIFLTAMALLLPFAQPALAQELSAAALAPIAGPDAIPNLPTPAALAPAAIAPVASATPRAASRSVQAQSAPTDASGSPLIQIGGGGGEEGGSVANRAIQLVLLLTVLSLAPGILMTVTSFTRIVVALSLLRTGIGAPGVPPNPVIISLALFLSFFVMAPTFEKAWEGGVKPYTQNQITEEQAFERTAEPFRQFMLKQVREDDLNLFAELSGKKVASRAEIGMATLTPAFMISELRRAFEIGFLLLLPFLIIDLAVAAVLMAMGMMMLPPPTISLPMKIIFFVLVDGWALVAGSLVKSFGAS